MTEIAVPEEQAGQDTETVSGGVLDGLDEQLIDRLVGRARVPQAYAA